jgi:dienelactone hydrolase
MKTFLKLLIIIFCSLSSICIAKPTTIHYAYAGNYKAILNTPALHGKHPAIIYSYDEFLDWVGGSLSLKVGYDPNTFAEAFTEWGYVTMIPISTSREINALRGAINYLKNHPKVDASRIYLIGMSESTWLSLLVTETYTDISRIVLISPKDINDKGYASKVNFTRNIEKLNAEILILGSQNDHSQYTQTQENMLKLLLKHDKQAKLKTYPYKKRWFWNAENAYMDDIKIFLRSEHASKNTYEPIQLPRKIEPPKPRGYFQRLL